MSVKGSIFSLAVGAAAIAWGGVAQASVTILSDNFDTHTDGAELTSVAPPVGYTSNYSLVAGLSSANVVQSAVNNGGNALQITRTDATGPQWGVGFWDISNGIVKASQVYTITYDLLRDNAESNTGAGIDLGYGPGDQNPTLLHGTGGVNNQILYRDSATASYIDTGYFTGYGGWETYEIVLTMSEADGGGKIYGTYDVYLTREDANNSEGLLARTLIVDDASAYSVGLTDNAALGRFLYYVGAPETGSGNDSVVYFDNLSVVTEPVATEPIPVPEPASLSLLAAGGLMLLRRRRS